MAKAEIKIDALVGYAYHYKESPNFNDKTFSDNKTSDVLLLRATYKSVSLLALNDSQGNFSAALIDSKSLYRGRVNLSTIYGLYLMRNDKQEHTKATGMSLPEFSIGPRDFSMVPLVGLQLDIPVTDRIEFTTVFTPLFTLAGIKLTIF